MAAAATKLLQQKCWTLECSYCRSGHLKGESTDVPIYRVLIHGTDFVMRFEDGAMERTGFYVNRHVRSDGPEAAGQVALDLVRLDPRLSGQLNVRLSVEEVAETDDELPSGIQPGFIFYDASAPPT